MFTGIIEEIGTVKAIEHSGIKSFISIKAKVVLDDIKLGDSIAVNGVCLTVTYIDYNSFKADVMNETLNRSSLGNLQIGNPVNLERAMPAYGRFGGHIVSGHIDGTGIVTDIRKDGNAVWYTVSANPDIIHYIVEKGSIAIDGISLTVAKVFNDCFCVSIIPHTLSQTILGYKKVGDYVNIENDIISKYVEKLMNHEKKNSVISMELLANNGFI